MAALGLASLLGRVPATPWKAARSPLLCNSLRKISSQGGKPEPSKQPLKKPKLPEGRFDAPEDSNLEKEPLTSKNTELDCDFFLQGISLTQGSNLNLVYFLH
ncbi:succinate dehydrogenase assembly factor 4, mitochondrial [Bubalus bubalis]|uniref:succinate dehydrogenase assembly factor 4, mitochondrial n=1 Tax=Bubalus bubalis TaxID=89462 RepID=UPI001E1B6F9B|nr:succinate dehydrogenase assembly factor 4, mitochondrial [Bubalus bubalis]